MKSLKLPKNLHGILKKKTQKKSIKLHGYNNEILFGLLFLIKKFPKKICFPLNLQTNLKKNNDIPFAIKWICSKKKHNIELPVSLTRFINSIKECKTQFIAIPLYIFHNCKSYDGHANCLIFDNKNRTIERFEPYGKSLDNIFNHKEIKIANQFDKAFSNLIKKLSYNYRSPYMFCPTINVQQHEEDNIEKGRTMPLDTDLEGFCSIWIIWYINLKLKHSNLDSSKLLYKSIDILKKDKRSIRSFIRKYALFLQKQMDTYSKKYKTDNLDTINKKIIKEITS